LRVFLRALCNLDPYTIIDDVAEHFDDDENNQRTAEEVLISTIDGLTDHNLTSFALRLALTGHVAIPRDREFDFLTEAEGAFIPPQPLKEKKPRKAPTPIRPQSKKTATKKKVAA
jgi:ParB family chromosome partitioning protein